MNVINSVTSEDGSVKYLIGLDDQSSVETLYMFDRDMRLTYHSTVCVSSQVGCGMACRFCATGKQGFVRNLSAEEIFTQVEICDKNRHLADFPPIDAVVFAGMGEPLLNLENVQSAIEMIRDRLGIKNFELATVGVVPGIRKLADFIVNSGIRLRLNISLHAAFDVKRSHLIPLTQQYGLDPLLRAADDFATITDTKVRLRYMLIKGFNDAQEDADTLIRLLSDRRMKLVISRYNDNNIDGLTAPEPLDVLDFCNKIKDTVDCDVFHNFGSAINGGCGQLRRNEKIS